MILTTILWECNYYFSYYRVNTREAEIIKYVMGAGKRLVFQHLREWWHVHAQVPSDAWDALNYLTKVRVLANGRARTWPCIFFFFFLNFLAVPGNMWKLSSLTRDWTCTLCSGPGLKYNILFSFLVCFCFLAYSLVVIPFLLFFYLPTPPPKDAHDPFKNMYTFEVYFSFLL